MLCTSSCYSRLSVSYAKTSLIVNNSMTNILSFVKKIDALFVIVIFYKNKGKKFILLKSIDKYEKILYTITNKYSQIEAQLSLNCYILAIDR